MKAARIMALLCALSAWGVADAQSTLRVRGTITRLDADTLAVKSRDGRDLMLRLPEDATVAVAQAVEFDDIKAGDYVGATTVPGPNGTHVALEVHYLAPTTPPGFGPWDLQPGSSMTNANVASVVLATGKQELVLQYKGGTQTVVVPQGIPLVRAVPGSRADLVPGEYIFTVAQVAADGSMWAPRLQVSKNGVKPPQ